MSYLVTSFFTIDTPYEEEAIALVNSIRKLDLRAHIEAVPNLGSWEKNCQHKASFLLEMIQRFPDTNLVWIDADAVFEKRPELFDSLDCDFAYHVLTPDNELLSGTLFLRNCKKVKHLLEDWVALNSSNHEWDQVNLQALLKKHADLDCVVLPSDYCKIFDNEEQDAVDP